MIAYTNPFARKYGIRLSLPYHKAVTPVVFVIFFEPLPTDDGYLPNAHASHEAPIIAMRSNCITERGIRCAVHGPYLS